jgi:hypothetical protein
MIAGGVLDLEPSLDDGLAYLREIGLIVKDLPVRIANPIYREVVVQALGTATEANIIADPRSFVLPDGRLDFDRMLREFADFWCEQAGMLSRQTAYQKSASYLVIMAFLQHVVDDRGSVSREYGLHRGRVDLLIRWPYVDGDEQVVQREAIELTRWHPGREDPLRDGLEQLDGYLSQVGLDRGTLVIFDRRPEAPPIDERIRFATTQTPTGRPVTLLRA